MRANSVRELEAALFRLRELLMRPEIRALREPMHDEVIVEGFIEGREFALEGVLEEGALRVLAIFDKPDPLDGPFFEETIYVTPTSLPEHDGLATAGARTMASTVAHAAAAIGLRHGPIHAECRINEAGVFVLEIAARPIGGLCARALRFSTLASDRPERDDITLEELLLRQATGESLDAYGREARASAVMMIPIPRRGFYKSVDGRRRGGEGGRDRRCGDHREGRSADRAAAGGRQLSRLHLRARRSARGGRRGDPRRARASSVPHRPGSAADRRVGLPASPAWPAAARNRAAAPRRRRRRTPPCSFATSCWASFCQGIRR